jgi:hypothetical protein
VIIHRDDTGPPAAARHTSVTALSTMKTNTIGLPSENTSSPSASKIVHVLVGEATFACRAQLCRLLWHIWHRLRPLER